MNKLAKSFLLIIMLLCPICFAAEGASVGKVLAASGEVVATQVSGETRTLARSSQIYLEDTIHTGQDGRVQVRFTDGTLVSLKTDSQLAIQQYHYDMSQKKGNAWFEFVKGSLRTLTGQIAKQQPENFKTNTPVATVGVRGTDVNTDVEQMDEAGSFRLRADTLRGGIRLSGHGFTVVLDSNWRGRGMPPGAWSHGLCDRQNQPGDQDVETYCNFFFADLNRPRINQVVITKQGDQFNFLPTQNTVTFTENAFDFDTLSFGINEDIGLLEAADNTSSLNSLAISGQFVF